MILKKHNISSNSQYFSINGSSDIKFLKVGLDETGLVLYFADHTYGDTSKYYNGVIIKDDGNDIHITPQMKCVGMEAGYAVFIEDYRDLSLGVDAMVNELELRASSGELDNLTQHLLYSYKEGFVKEVLVKLESRDLIDLQQKLIIQAQDLEIQLKQKQEVITQIETIATELGYQMDFVNKCRPM